MINQAPIVRYTASVSEKFFPNFWRKTFSAESDYEVKSSQAPVTNASPWHYLLTNAGLAYGLPTCSRIQGPFSTQGKNSKRVKSFCWLVP
jgi:hypothetical protein